jgi:Putative DNA-binding domain
MTHRHAFQQRPISLKAKLRPSATGPDGSIYGMWLPTSAEALISAIDDNVLPHESATIEVKAALPEKKANRDIAVDVAAMATDGGVIVYGVREDKQTSSYTAEPLVLSGAKDRISDVVSSHLREHVEFDVRLLPLASDLSRGFVLIDVPASVRAPHMVEVRGEHRYYGRVPGGNQMLTESQVARLYERRQRAEEEALSAIDALIAKAPLEPAPAVRGDLHLLIRPLLSEASLRDQLWEGREEEEIRKTVAAAFNGIQFASASESGLSEFLQFAHPAPTLEGYELYNTPIERPDEVIDRYVERIEVLDDGTTRYFCAAVAQQWQQSAWQPSIATPGMLVFLDVKAARRTAHLVLFAGLMLTEAGYRGPVDVSLALTSIDGSVSSEWLNGQLLPPPGGLPALAAPDGYRQHVRVAAPALAQDPCQVTKGLFARLFRVSRANGFADPLLCANSEP